MAEAHQLYSLIMEMGRQNLQTLPNRGAYTAITLSNEKSNTLYAAEFGLLRFQQMPWSTQYRVWKDQHVGPINLFAFVNWRRDKIVDLMRQRDAAVRERAELTAKLAVFNGLADAYARQHGKDWRLGITDDNFNIKLYNT